jgi:hypothetical protein
VSETQAQAAASRPRQSEEDTLQFVMAAAECDRERAREALRLARSGRHASAEDRVAAHAIHLLLGLSVA